MERTFHLFQELSNVVVIEAGAKAEITSVDLKGLLLFHTILPGQAGTQSLVDRVLKGTSGLPHHVPELRGYVFVEGQGGSHIMMLAKKHHNV